jgi:hypothetical protein
LDAVQLDQDVTMLARATLKRPEEPAERRPQATQKRPTEERFLVKVDGQPKRSFDDKDAATRFGAEIKNKYPVVVVTVTDTSDGATERL